MKTVVAAPRDDAGFTLVEVVVAIGIFLVVMTALVPQLITGLRAVTVANTSTVLKTVAQQEIERLRGLPFRVSLGGDSTTIEPDIDLLDLYFPNLDPATAPNCVDA